MKSNNLYKIAFYGDGEWALNTLKPLIRSKVCSIDTVFARFPKGDKEIELFCKKNKLKYIKTKNINDYILNSNLKFDIGISVSFDQIFKKETISSHKKGLINCHAGNLPDYKGRNILNWALINNEKSFGISVHYIDSGVDTGDIILQKSFKINHNDDYKDLLDLAYLECPKIVLDSIDLIIKNKVKPISQKNIKKHPIYCSRRREGDEIINWESSSLEIYNFIRALVYPGPFAQTYLNNDIIYIKKSEYIPDAPIYKGIPGSVIKKDENGFLVKTGDSYILIKDWEAKISINNGDRF